MQIPVKEPTTSAGVDQATAEQIATHYIAQTLGEGYGVHALKRLPDYWLVQLCCHVPTLARPMVVGRLRVQAQTGNLFPLTEDEIQEIQERTAVMAAYRRQEVARDAQGFILPYQAKIRVNGYLAKYVTFFASATGRPQWIAGSPPCWRVTTTLCMGDQDSGCELSAIDVNAQTGEIIPLTNQQIQTLQRRAHHAAESVASASAATS
jgi:hypothetical protein